MKILRVIASVDPATGGPVAGLRAITPELARLGHETEFLTVDDPAADFLKNAVTRVHACGPVRGSYANSTQVRSWLRAHAADYDAVVVHGLWQDLGRAVREVCAEKNRPYFVFPHGMLDPSLRQTYPLRHFKKWVYWLLAERRVLRDARSVFFTCEEERRLARQSFPLYSVRECVVKYGVAAPPDGSRGLGASSSDGAANRTKPYWLFLGRIHSKKGLELLLPAYAQLVRERASGCHAGLPRLVIAGPAQPRYREHLKAIAKALGISDQIEWPGMLGDETKQAMLANAEVFVLPSHQENFGIAVADGQRSKADALLKPWDFLALVPIVFLTQS